MEELGDVYRGVLLAPVVLMGAGVLWSPFGAGVCALVAWLQRQPIGEAAGAGFSHSLLLLLPWFYLLGRTLGLRLPQGVGHVSAGAVFGALYALWAINYLASPVVAVVLEGGFNGSTITVGEQVILLAATVVLLLASGAAWVWSGQRVWRQWRTRAPAASALMGQDWHLEPWAWLVGLTLAFLLYVAMAAAMGFTGQ